MSILARAESLALGLLTVLLLTNPVTAKANSDDAGIKFLGCHGELFYEGFEEKDILGGAYNAWCYDKSGQKVAKIHHDAPLPAFVTGQFEIRFIHYDDRNHDGVLEDKEIDGTIHFRVRNTPETLDRSVLSYSGRTFVIANEVPAEDDVALKRKTKVLF
jgi:hypothetical protein